MTQDTIESLKRDLDRWVESHDGECYDSSMIRDDPDRYDNPIGYARSFNWILRRDDLTLDISYSDGNHPSELNEDVSGEFDGTSVLSIEIRGTDIGWRLTGDETREMRIEDDEITFNSGDEEIRIDEDLQVQNDSVDPITREKCLNPDTKYFRALIQFPIDRWLTTEEIVESVDLLVDRTDAHSVLGSLRDRGAIESRPHPDGGRRNQYRVTDHGRSEIDRRS